MAVVNPEMKPNHEVKDSKDGKKVDVVKLLNEISAKFGLEGTLEQDGFLCGFNNIPQQDRQNFLLRLHAAGFVNALWDDKRQRIAVPTVSFYPDHDIAKNAKSQLSALGA